MNIAELAAADGPCQGVAHVAGSSDPTRLSDSAFQAWAWAYVDAAK